MAIRITLKDIVWYFHQAMCVSLKSILFIQKYTSLFIKSYSMVILKGLAIWF